MTFELRQVSVGMSHTPFTPEANSRLELVKRAGHHQDRVLDLSGWIFWLDFLALLMETTSWS